MKCKYNQTKIAKKQITKSIALLGNALVKANSFRKRQQLRTVFLWDKLHIDYAK